MKLSELLNGHPYQSVFSADDIIVNSICEKASEAKSDDVLIVMTGKSFDPAPPVCPAAIITNASEKELDTEVPCFYVENIRAVRALLWSRFYGEPQKKLSLTAITGTNGKTTTAHMLSYLYTAARIRTGYIGTLGVFDGEEKLEEYGEEGMTTPSSKELFRALDALVKRGVTHAILEISSHALHQERVYPLRFRTAIFTNLSEDHLDYHQNMEEYYLAKAKLFTICEKALINIDDAYGERLYQALPCPKYSFAVLRNADFRITDLHEKGGARTQYTCIFSEEHIPISYPLFGAFNIYNSLAALSCALLEGIGSADLCHFMETLPSTQGRLEHLNFGKKHVPFSVIIDYAHTPDAMLQTIRAVRKITRGNLYVLFGAGGEREREKRAVMGRIAEEYADFVFVTADNSRSEELQNIIRDIVSGMKHEKKRRVMEKRKDAICSALSLLKCGDTLLLLGKGHEEYIIDQNGRRPFSERETVQNWIEAHYDF